MRSEPERVLRASTSSENRSPISSAFVASVVAHLCVLLVGPRLLPWNTPDSTASGPYAEHEIEIAPEEKTEEAAPTELAPPLEQPTNDRNRVAETERAGQQDLADSNAFLGDHSQKVEKESRAKKTDSFRESRQDGRDPISELSVGDLLVEAGRSEVSGSTSASDDHVEGVDLGDRTELNTREFRYMSFYRRVKDSLRDAWKPSVERRFQRLTELGMLPRKTQYVTLMVATLDESGRVLAIRRERSSGVEAFDLTAEEAFQEVGHFGNPPSALLDKKRKIQLRWEFVVSADRAGVSG